LGRHNKALAMHPQALELAEGDFQLQQARYCPGYALQARGQRDEAVAHYRKILPIRPDALHAIGWQEATSPCPWVLTWLLATSPDVQLRDPALAVALTKKAIEMRP
jgi:tetratricopeptide (TPR) repeat protein